MTLIKSTQVFVASLCVILFASLASASVATVENYDYPISDRFAATVVGTPAEFQAQLPESIPFKQRRITIFPERVTPDVFFYGRELLYSRALQKHEAPLIFLIAGTGASHNGGKNHNMARAFYQAGFHVVSVSSPTFNNFVTAASATGVVGHAEKDAEDIYRVFEMIWADLEDDIDVTSFNVTGYSLGGGLTPPMFRSLTRSASHSTSSTCCLSTRPYQFTTLSHSWIAWLRIFRGASITSTSFLMI